MSLSMCAHLAGTGLARISYMLGFTALKMPPTSTGFQFTATPSSRAIGWMLWKAR